MKEIGWLKSVEHDAYYIFKSAEQSWHLDSVFCLSSSLVTRVCRFIMIMIELSRTGCQDPKKMSLSLSLLILT